MLLSQIKYSVDSCIKALEIIGEDNYLFSLKNNSSVGSHIRHMIDRMNCVLNGVQTGEINYDSRQRDAEIEAKIDLSKNALIKIKDSFNSLKCDLNSEVKVIETLIPEGEALKYNSTISREIADLVLHNVHHLAIIKIILNGRVKFGDSFAKAASTVQYEKEQG